MVGGIGAGRLTDGGGVDEGADEAAGVGVGLFLFGSVDEVLN